MIYKEFTEARKNPDQNPKTPINQILANAVKSVKGKIAGVPNLFVSFTTVDKLGINPQTQYETPIGIYSYPGNYVVKHVGKTKSMDTLPFAGDSPYVNTFSASGKIINISNIADTEVEKYYKTIYKICKKASPETTDNIDLYIQLSYADAHRNDLPGGRLWFVTKEVSDKILSKIWKTAPYVAWNKLFRLMGIDGVVDSGDGIIHYEEPTQAVFFYTGVLTNIRRYHNKYSPDVTSSPGHIKQIPKISQTTGVKHIPQIPASTLKVQPQKTDLSIDQQKSALSQDINSYYTINNLDEPTFISALTTAIKTKQPIKDSYISVVFPNASRPLQKLAVQLDPRNIVKFNNPDPALIQKVIKHIHTGPGNYNAKWAKALKALAQGEFHIIPNRPLMVSYNNYLLTNLKAELSSLISNKKMLKLELAKKTQSLKASGASANEINQQVSTIITKIKEIERAEEFIQSSIDMMLSINTMS